MEAQSGAMTQDAAKVEAVALECSRVGRRAQRRRRIHVLSPPRREAHARARLDSGQLAAPRDAALVVATEAAGRGLLRHRTAVMDPRLVPLQTDGARGHVGASPRSASGVTMSDEDAHAAGRIPLSESVAPGALQARPTELQLVCAPGRCCNVAPEGQGFYACSQWRIHPRQWSHTSISSRTGFEELKVRVRSR